MALFRPYQRPGDKPARDAAPAPSGSTRAPRRSARTAAADPIPEPVVEATPARRGPVRKDAPTPTRRQAERERMERLHPTLSPKEQRRLERRQSSEKQQQRYIAMESTPEKKLLRDFVDSRFHPSEVLLPVMLILMAVTLFVAPYWLPAVYIGTYGTWAVLLLTIADVAYTWWRFRGLLAERLPHASRRGLFGYLLNRLIQFRSFRRPAPMVKRGATI